MGFSALGTQTGVERRGDATPSVYWTPAGAADDVRQPDVREEEDRRRCYSLAAQDEPGRQQTALYMCASIALFVNL